MTFTRLPLRDFPPVPIPADGTEFDAAESARGLAYRRDTKGYVYQLFRCVDCDTWIRTWFDRGHALDDTRQICHACYLKRAPRRTSGVPCPLSNTCQAVLNAIRETCAKGRGTVVSDIAASTQFDVGKIRGGLAELVRRGIVTKTQGAYFTRSEA